MPIPTRYNTTSSIILYDVTNFEFHQNFIFQEYFFQSMHSVILYKLILTILSHDSSLSSNLFHTHIFFFFIIIFLFFFFFFFFACFNRTSLQLILQYSVISILFPSINLVFISPFPSSLTAFSSFILSLPSGGSFKGGTDICAPLIRGSELVENNVEWGGADLLMVTGETRDREINR